MPSEFTKTKIDKLGERLKHGNVIEADLRILDEYRRSFGDAYGTVLRTIREDLGLEPTGRPAKSTTSIGDKLNRESIRLTQIQDIAGCRLIVSDIIEQDKIVQLLQSSFQNVSVIDRRTTTSHGYRAVHVIVKTAGKPVEIQVRTALQHVWAEQSEKLSDMIDPAIKYGGGNQQVTEYLTYASDGIAYHENLITQLQRRLTELKGQVLIDADRLELQAIEKELEEHTQTYLSGIRRLGETLVESLEGKS